MSEHTEQCAVIDWADAHADKYLPLGWIYAIPNGASTGAIGKNKLKAEGLKPGVADLCLPAARQDYHGLYIEMKLKGGKVSEGQNEFLAYLETEQYLGVVCFSAAEAIEQLRWYLGIGECLCIACQIADA